ncbi:hypothetical protein SH668x_002045 [Planctomicrobium sp. SH668]|uniref:hypothetical protein n=1 Tax=Planctomicrobium sp. SH668 TaxID=3448126 RepID=UPI003F5C912E
MVTSETGSEPPGFFISIAHATDHTKRAGESFPTTFREIDNLERVTLVTAKTVTYTQQMNAHAYSGGDWRRM